MQSDQVKKKNRKEDNKRLPLPKTSLAFLESLSMPEVQEIVISADMQCKECQKKVYDVISRTKGTESMVVDIREKKVILTYKSEMNEYSNKIVPIQKNSTLKIFRNFLFMIKN